MLKLLNNMKYAKNLGANANQFVLNNNCQEKSFKKVLELIIDNDRI